MTMPQERMGKRYTTREGVVMMNFSRKKKERRERYSLSDLKSKTLLLVRFFS